MSATFVFAEPGHFTALPNALFDGVQPHLSLSAWSVLCVVLRRTRGWGKSSDAISYAQIKAATGIKSDTTVARALAELLCSSLFGTAILCRDTQTGTSGQGARYTLNARFALELAPCISPQPTPKNEDQTPASSPQSEEPIVMPSPENGDTKEREFNSSLALQEDQAASSKTGLPFASSEEVASDQTEGAVSTTDSPRSTASLTAMSHLSSQASQSPLFRAVCAATQRDPALVSNRMRTQLADCAHRLAHAGYDAGQVELAAKRWPLPTAPYPSQLLDNIQSLLAARPLSPPTASPCAHVPHSDNPARRVAPARSGFENAAARKARKWEQWLDELT